MLPCTNCGSSLSVRSRTCPLRPCMHSCKTALRQGRQPKACLWGQARFPDLQLVQAAGASKTMPLMQVSLISSLTKAVHTGLPLVCKLLRCRQRRACLWGRVLRPVLQLVQADTVALTSSVKPIHHDGMQGGEGLAFWGRVPRPVLQLVQADTDSRTRSVSLFP